MKNPNNHINIGQKSLGEPSSPHSKIIQGFHITYNKAIIMSKFNYNCYIAACYLFEVYHLKLKSHKTAGVLHTIKKLNAKGTCPSFIPTS